MEFLIDAKRLMHIVQKEYKGSHSVAINWFVDESTAELCVYVSDQFNNTFIYTQPFISWDDVPYAILEAITPKNQLLGIQERKAEPLSTESYYSKVKY